MLAMFLNSCTNIAIFTIFRLYMFLVYGFTTVRLLLYGSSLVGSMEAACDDASLVQVGLGVMLSVCSEKMISVPHFAKIEAVRFVWEEAIWSG